MISYDFPIYYVFPGGGDARHVMRPTTALSSPARRMSCEETKNGFMSHEARAMSHEPKEIIGKYRKMREIIGNHRKS